MSAMLFLDDLFEVQRVALQKAHDKPGFAFFMEQGLGKTRTVYYEFYDLAGRELADVLIVICPPTLRGAWEDEMGELGLTYPFHRLNGVKKWKAWMNDVVKGQPCVIVINYELVLTQGTEVIQALLARRKHVYMALDESVRIKSWSSVIGERLVELTLAYKRIKVSVKPVRWLVLDAQDPAAVKRCQAAGTLPESFLPHAPVAYKRVLSGTPAPQGIHDMWNQLRFLGLMHQGIQCIRPYFAFRAAFCKMGGFMAKKVVGVRNLDMFKEKYEPNIFRAKKVDWTDLPEKLWAKPREVDLSERQRRAYLEIMHDFVLELGPDDYVTVEMAITVKNKLQQIASGWVYDNEHVVRELVPLTDNPKLQEAAAVVNDIVADSKILVFYFFRPTRDYLAQLAEDNGWKHVFLESGLKEKEFDERKHRFNGDDDVRVAFCQIDAVKEGHTLLGTKDVRCFNTLFLENTYSLYARSQGEDRNHRHGQYNPVTYHDIVTSREDKAIIKALQTKASMQEAILAEFTAFNSKLSIDTTAGV